MSMTTSDYVWLAQVFAVLSENYMNDEVLRAKAYDYFTERLSIKYPNFDAKKFEEEYKRMRLMIW